MERRKKNYVALSGRKWGRHQLPNALHWAEIYLAFSQKVVPTLQVRAVA
jgi:hypothetical protein